MPLCLIVDDDPMSCKIAADVAGSANLEVRIESNGVNALTFCRDKMPEVIILDVQMPRMGGVEFLHNLHKMIGGRRPYVIACTAMNDMETVKALKEEDVNAYLVKPYEGDALLQKIKASGVV